MFDWKMILNIVVGVVIAAVVVALGGMLMHKTGMKGDRGYNKAEKSMMEDHMEGDAMEGDAMMEAEVMVQ